MPIIRRITGALRPGVDADQDFLNAQAYMGVERLARYRRYEDAYNGDQRYKLTPRQRTFLEDDFNENFIETVIDALADRLTLTGFQVQDDDDASDWLTATAWARAGGANVQNVVHTMTPVYGDGFVIVDFDNATGLPRARWNRPHNLKPTYDEETGELLHVAKVWPTSAPSASNPSGHTIRRLNLYYPDRVEKWFTPTTGDDSIWAHHLDTAGDLWPTPWVLADEEPIGVTVFPFRHKPLGQTFGRSRVKGALPFQHELIKQILDLFEVRDQQGWPQRWGSGVAETAKLSVAIGELLTTTEPGARFGQFDAAPIEPALSDIAATLTRLAAKTRTPMHDLVAGLAPSGEALKTAEGGIVLEARDCHVGYGASWSDVGAMMLRLGTAFGEPGIEVDPDAQVIAVWDDPETRNAQTETTTAGLLYDLGASRQTLLRRLGFDPDEEARLRALEPSELPVLP